MNGNALQLSSWLVLGHAMSVSANKIQVAAVQLPQAAMIAFVSISTQNPIVERLSLA